MSDDSGAEDDGGRAFEPLLTGNEPWLDLALRAFDQELWPNAIHHLRRLLGSDPEHALGHALLSICLVQTNRLFAAEHEANRAAALDPQLPTVHLALGGVALGKKRLDEARASFETALSLEPENVAAHLSLAELRRLAGDTRGQRLLLERVLSMAPDDVQVLVALGVCHLTSGALDEAARYAEEARALAPDSVPVLVLFGELALRAGRVDEARDHALWALQESAVDSGALSLLASVKARESPLLGLWWRYSVWMQAKGDTAQIVILIAAWLVVQVLELALKDLGQVQAAEAVSTVWLGVAIYSWVGPLLFQRALEKELTRVRLREDF